ncbi:unnamed protein product, partial [Didymodactylos carnosus]
FPYSSVDITLAFKLNFQLNIVKRIKRNRPKLYHKIKNITIYLVPKSSKQSLYDKEYEFRYSFSKLESELADALTRNEKLLNAVVRKIFYTYLHEKISVNLDDCITKLILFKPLYFGYVKQVMKF